ncbi:MAG: DUF4126 domain-containing protein [Gemmatimonadales bacterium]
MTNVESIGLALGTSFAAGLNAYATVALLGAAQHFGFVALPTGLDILGHPAVIIAAGVLFFIEFFADKIPYVDSVWDAIHTLVRPAAAAGLGWGIFNTQPATMQAIAALLAGTVALTSHGAKATTRAAANTSPEPFSNIILSVIEDVLAAGLTWLAMAHPVVTAFIVVILLGFAVLIIRGLVRFFKRTLGSPPASATS